MRAGGLQREAALDLSAHLFGGWGGGVPELVDLAVLDGGDLGVVVVEGEWDELDTLAFVG